MKIQDCKGGHELCNFFSQPICGGCGGRRSYKPRKIHMEPEGVGSNYRASWLGWLVRSLCPFQRRVLGHPGRVTCVTSPKALLTPSSCSSKVESYHGWSIFCSSFHRVVVKSQAGHKSLVQHFGMKNLVDITSFSWHLTSYVKKPSCIFNFFQTLVAASLLHLFGAGHGRTLGIRADPITSHHESEPYSFHHPRECAFPKSWVSSWSAMWCPSQMVCGQFG